VVFQTSGDDDASCNHTVDELRSLIGRRKAEGWQVIILGASSNAYPAARAQGRSAHSVTPRLTTMISLHTRPLSHSPPCDYFAHTCIRASGPQPPVLR